MIIVALVTCLAAPPAGAEIRRPSSEAARRMLVEANKHYKVREFDKAIELYKKGALIEPAPIFWYNLGQSFRQQGSFKDAIWYYQRFLGVADGADERGQVERLIAEMEKELAGRTRTERPEPAPEPQRPPPPPPPPVIVERPAVPPPPPPPPPAAPSRAPRIAAIATGAAGVALLGIGAGFGLDARSKWSSAREQCGDGPSPLPCTAEGVSLRESASRSATLSTVAAAAGVVALATGVTLYVVTRPRERPAAITVVPALGPGTAAVSLQGGF
jgi:hypothetical protein